MKVVCIGSGNVATHMAIAFKAAGADLVQVWSKDPDNAALLADIVGAKVVLDLSEIEADADLYLIAIKDDAIEKVSRAIKHVNGIVVHTSGATSIDVLSPFKNHGVLYPLQTFSKSKQVDFANVPLCIEANNLVVLNELKAITTKLSHSIYEMSSEKRKVLHLAAVFACNFVNHLYTLSEQILQDHQIDFGILKPLISETAEKVQTDLPVNVQTGPAIRNDEQTMSAHLDLLINSPQLKEIYQVLSNSIKNTH